MAGLVPGIHVFRLTANKTWMAGYRRAEATPSCGRLRPAMTSLERSSFFQRTGNSMSASVTDSIDGAGPMLFEPFKIRDLTLKNRLVVPPMVHYRAGPGNICGSFHNLHLGRYALGGFGLVFVEATAVLEGGPINEHDLCIWNDAQVQRFKSLIAFVEGDDAAIGIQLA